MDLQIELYTTPTVEGRKILSSKGFVCANVVLYAGVIDESREMMQKLPEYLYKGGVEPYHVELFDALEREVLNKGGNAVIDLHIEHNYVKCGQYDYSLLISAQGTAVVLEGINIPENKNIKGKVLERQILRKQILTELNEWHKKCEERIKDDRSSFKSAGRIADNFGFIPPDYFLFLSDKEWMFVCNYPDMLYANDLHFAYTEGVLDDNLRDKTIRYSRYFKYFKQLPYEIQIELAYKYGGWRSSDLVVQCDLFDSKRILEWAQKGEFEFATACLDACKKEYSAQDLEDMQCLYDFFANLPTDKTDKITKNPDSNGKYKYKCINCDYDFESRDADEYYCPHCKKGKKGLTQEQEERVNSFRIKIETLKELLSCNN